MNYASDCHVQHDDLDAKLRERGEAGWTLVEIIPCKVTRTDTVTLVWKRGVLEIAAPVVRGPIGDDTLYSALNHPDNWVPMIESILKEWGMRPPKKGVCERCGEPTRVGLNGAPYDTCDECIRKFLSVPRRERGDCQQSPSGTLIDESYP